MGTIFGERLKRQREEQGISGYRICQVSGMPQANFIAIEKGRRPPSDTNLEALASVEELGVTLEQLQAWRDLDRIGLDGVERIKKWLPEVLAAPPPPTSIADAAAAGEEPPKRKPTPQIPGVTRGMPKVKPIPEADLYETIRDEDGLTPEEQELIREAEELNVDVGDVGTPDFLAQPVEERRKTVLYRQKQVEAARKKAKKEAGRG